MNSLHGKRAILYRRVSTTDQRVYGNSLGAQRDALRAFCNSNGIEIIREFEEDFSAKTFEKRSVFQELLDFAKSHRAEIDLLLATRIDRFSRNSIETHSMIRQLGTLSRRDLAHARLAGLSRLLDVPAHEEAACHVQYRPLMHSVAHRNHVVYMHM